jgi:hypothetical protein
MISMCRASALARGLLYSTTQHPRMRRTLRQLRARAGSKCRSTYLLERSLGLVACGRCSVFRCGQGSRMWSGGRCDNGPCEAARAGEFVDA